MTNKTKGTKKTAAEASQIPPEFLGLIAEKAQQYFEGQRNLKLLTDILTKVSESGLTYRSEGESCTVTDDVELFKTDGITVNIGALAGFALPFVKLLAERPPSIIVAAAPAGSGAADA